MKYEIFGFGFSFEHQLTDVNAEFEGDYCEWDATMFSKKTFALPVGSGNRQYKLYISATSCEDGGTGYEVGMVFLPRSLHKKQREKVMDEFDDLDESELTVEDVYNTIGGVRLYYQFFDKEDEVKKEKLDVIASIVDAITRLIGFALDKPYDRLGSDGWDMVNMYTNNFQPYSTKTFKKRMKEYKSN